jgi:hypothetical protein
MQDRAQLRAKCEDAIVQLTARCAGFLEVSNPEEKGINSLIQYFHRTARDFLETYLCHSKLNMAPVSTDSEPLTALITSHILVLENEQIMAEINRNEIPDFRGIIDEVANNIMIYACHTEDHAEKYECRNVLIDRFFSVMGQCDQIFISLFFPGLIGFGVAKRL